MTWLEVAAVVAKSAQEVMKEHQKWFIHYLLVSFFWKSYLQYLTKSLVLEGVAKTEAEKQIAKFEDDPYPAMMLLQWESEIGYRNMFGVLQKTLPKIQAPWEWWEIDPDKLKRLKDLSKEFSSDEMQEYIAWILAWEYNKPWSYSLQTMAVVKNLSKEEMNLFRKFCWLIVNWDFLFENFFRLENVNKLAEKWIQYEDYLYLQELWLLNSSVSVQEIRSFTKTIHQFTIANTICNLHLKWIIVLKDKVFLTKVWRELFNLIDPIFDEDLFSMVKQELIRQGFTE